MSRPCVPIKQTITPPKPHWVGNGFFMHGFFGEFLPENSPFLLLDYGVKRYFEPSNIPRGVGMHPHRGFETVTIALHGRVEHIDNQGNRGIIQEGGVQWMTAGAGIIHQEYLETEFNKTGGEFQMIQLWVNLPAKNKMTKPRYQAITKEQIPVVELGNNRLRIIAGMYAGVDGPAQTFSPIDIFLIDLVDFYIMNVAVGDGTGQPITNMLLVIEGDARLRGVDLKANHLYILNDHSGAVPLSTEKGAKILFLSGQKLDEPLVHYGPFVMNTAEQINEAIDDYNQGKF